MIDNTELDELLALAEKVQLQGPWDVVDPGDEDFIVQWDSDDVGSGFTIIAQGYRGEGEAAPTAWYIAAANPETIRALVQEVKDWRTSSAYIYPPITAFTPVKEPPLE